MDAPSEKLKNSEESETPKTDPSDQPSLVNDDVNRDELKPEVTAVESKVEEIEAAEEPAAPAPPLPGTEKPETGFKIKKPEGKFKRLLKSKKFWLIFGLSLLAIVVALWFIQPTRLYFVNLLGLKVPVAVTTRTVAEPGRPSSLLKSVTVTVNGAQLQSNDEGVVQTTVPYGPVSVGASKAGYEATTVSDFYDFNPFFNLIASEPKNGQERAVEVALKSVGLPLKFVAKDWLSGNPITTGKFSVGDVVAQPDNQGVVSLKVPPTDEKTVKIKAVFGGTFNDIEFEVQIQEDPLQEQLFVPAGKDYFVSKRSGQLAVYSSNLDGTGVTEIVPASANETASVDFAVSPSGKYAVLASTREGKKDSSGQLLQKLYVVNLATNQLTAVDEARWFSFIDWSGDILAYTTFTNDTAPRRLASVDTTANKKVDLGSANYYGTARVSLGNVVYIMGHASGEPAAANNSELRIVSIKGGAEKNIGNKVEQISQTDFDKFAYKTSDNAWHQYDGNNGQVTNIAAPTSTERAYLNATSPDGQVRLLIDRIDGKNTLITESVASGQEKQLHGAAGLQGPIRWVGNTIVFRIADSQQSADYVIAGAGGTPKKITDVTNTPNINADYFGFY